MILLKKWVFGGGGAAARAGLLLLLVTVGGVGRTQQPGQQRVDPTDPLKTIDGSSTEDKRSGDPGRAASAERQAKLRNEDRQKRLVSDTDKLLALVTQLHEDVAKTDKNILSVDVVKRADEIEKLARSVKEHMKE